MSWLYNYESWLYKNWYPFRAISPIVGYDQARATKESNKAQIEFNQYQKAAYQRALQDWYRNVKGRSIRYPELSYPGNIRSLDTSSYRADLSSYSADANLYRANINGLYGVGSRLSRYL